MPLASSAMKITSSISTSKRDLNKHQKTIAFYVRLRLADSTPWERWNNVFPARRTTLYTMNTSSVAEELQRSTTPGRSGYSSGHSSLYNGKDVRWRDPLSHVPG